MKNKDNGTGDKPGEKMHKVSLEPREVVVNSQDKKFLDEFLDFLERMLSDKKINLITIDRLCDKFYLTRSTLNRKVKALTGESPMQFIQSYRLKRAKQLLENKAVNVSEVAELVGFVEESNFSRAFKKKFDQSPKVYQKNHLKKSDDKTRKKQSGAPENRDDQTQMSIRIDFTLDELDREFISRIVATKTEYMFNFRDKAGTPQRNQIMKQVEKLYEPPISLSSNEALAPFTLREIARKMRKEMERMRRDIRYAYGIAGYTDKRFDFHNINDDRVRRDAFSVAAVCLEEDLLPGSRGYSKLRTKKYGDTFNLCTTESFYRQPIAAGHICTGVLVSEDVVVTTADFVDDKDVSGLCFVFGFAIQVRGKPAEQIPTKDIYKGVEILERGQNPEGNWVLVRLDRKVTDREIALLSQEDIRKGERVYVIGHPCGLPLKYAPGISASDIADNYFSANLDVYGSNSGSPVFRAKTHELIGIVSCAQTPDFRWSGNCWITMRYPRTDPDYQGSKCIKGSEFIKSVQQLKEKRKQIKQSTPKRVIVDIVSQIEGGLTLSKEVMTPQQDYSQGIGSPFPGESTPIRFSKKSIPIKWENGEAVFPVESKEILVIRPSEGVDIQKCVISVKSVGDVDVLSSNTQSLWKIRFPSSDDPGTPSPANVNVTLSEGKTDFDTPVQESAEFIEDELRNVVAEGLYEDGKDYLQKIMQISPERKEALKEEFGFICDFNNPKKEEAQVNWRRKVWQILSANCNFELLTSEESETQANNKDKEKSGVDKGKEKSKQDTKKNKTPGEKGEELEKAVFELLEMFFDNCMFEKTFQPISSRQQDKGRQAGHDLKFVVGTSENREMRILIECKNYSNKIKLANIADKLLAAKAYHQNIVSIDHWILVSPNTYVSNELNELLESWEKHGEYPFKVQAWTKDAIVKDFFGLIPGIYDRIITEKDHKIHPKEWTGEDIRNVMETWKEKLAPPLRLPKGWVEYLRKPEKLLRQGESQELADIYDCHIEMNCKDETGVLIHGKTLEDKIYEWLEKPIKDHPTLILLGDFGDGKTTFCYIISRKLTEQFLKSPSSGWLSVRFSLNDFSISNVNTSRDLLRRRLEEFGANIDGWDTITKSKYNLLAILDGFDEMSKKMDHKNILKNIKQIVECYQKEFSGMKVLITSRKHFFENQQHKAQLLQRIKNPQILMLAPIKRIKTEEHLREYAKGIGEEEKFDVLINRHDPIGLASKPLYLEMVKGSLKELPNKDLDELVLYETYIQKSFERKGDFLEDENLETPPDKIIENMKEILEIVAVKLHQSDKEFIYLTDAHNSRQLLMGLWKMSDPEEYANDDEMGRIAVRSLLKRVETDRREEGKEWPVDFCHRSMREYFVARAVRKMVGHNPEQAKDFLRSCSLSYEIIFFASKMMKKNSGFDYTENLWQLIQETKYHKDKEKLKVGSLGSNAANLLYQYKGKIPKSDWSNLVLDGVDFSGSDLSGKDFSYTSFHYANLDNVNFSNADFSGCDLTGVRLEEASPVHAVAVSQDEKIYALYEDGIIREWIHNRVRSPYSVSLEKIETTNDILLIAQPGNDLTLIDNNHLKYYDKEKEKIIQKALFGINPAIKPINIFRDRLLLCIEKNRRYSLQLINLENLSIIQSVSVDTFTLCAYLGDSAFIIYDESDGLQIVDSGSGEPKTIIQPDNVNITCIASCPCEKLPDHWRLAFGKEDGTVTIFNINVSTWDIDEVLKYDCHDKMVRDITFIDDNRVVSGGADRKILLTQINRDKSARGTFIEFKLNLQCKGMKIDGVKPDEKKFLLEKLIAQASCTE